RRLGPPGGGHDGRHGRAADDPRAVPRQWARPDRGDGRPRVGHVLSHHRRGRERAGPAPARAGPGQPGGERRLPRRAQHGRHRFRRFPGHRAVGRPAGAGRRAGRGGAEAQPGHGAGSPAAAGAGAPEGPGRVAHRRFAAALPRVPGRGPAALGGRDQGRRHYGAIGRPMTAAIRAQSIEDLRRAARRRLPRAIFDFFDGGAEDELTLAANRAAYAQVRLAPRALVNVAEVSTHAEVAGGPATMPLAVAPTGAVGYGRPGGDIAIARAAAAAGVPYTLSTSATASIEQIANAAPGRLWFQAYILRNRELLDALIARARAADYEALMITVDLPVGGKRERDARNHLSFPFRYTARNLLDFASRPAGAVAVLRHGLPVMENLKGLEAPAASATRLASSVG